MDLLKRALDHDTRTLHLADLPNTEAAFATNAAVRVGAISGVDGIEFPDSHEAIDTLGKVYVHEDSRRLGAALPPAVDH